MTEASALATERQGALDRLFAACNPRVLDRVEQVTIAILWLWLVQRVLHSGNSYAPLVLVAETALVFFTLIRRPTTNISLRLGDWLLAITATAAPLLIVPTDVPVSAVAPLGVALVIVGNIIQGAAKLALRRSFGIAPANRGIKDNGIYGLVRHPMYAGYLAVHIGLLILMPSFLNILVYAIGWWAQILRLLAEERLLSQDPAYVAFQKKVRYRLIPGIF